MLDPEVNHLVIVHPNMLEPWYENDLNLINAIRQRALLTLQSNKEVFLLPIGPDPIEAFKLFDDIFPESKVVPFDIPLKAEPSVWFFGATPQFIHLKNTLKGYSILQVDIVGVARSACVRMVDNILCGENYDPRLIELAEALYLSQKELSEILNDRISTRIIEKLCA